MTLTTVGDVMVDVVSERLPAAGERVHGSVRLRPGGSAVNAALTAAALGASARVVGRIGTDAAGELLIWTLKARGIDAHLARDDELPTGTAVALRDAVVADRGANARLLPADLPSPLRGDALLVSGFALFQDGSRDAARAALDRFEGAWSAVDLASPALAPNASHGVDHANVVFATAEEAGAATGFEPEDAARELAHHFDVVCIKLGSEGALAVRGDRLDRAAVEPVARVSPFGAGDAFAAAFLVELSSGKDVGNALLRACQAGARASSSGYL
ncbi:MAG TPA: carbohydrate kinase family protein [Gaiellaceae bacterium]|nr:carbohydrate kinase family protein [Gaiellaceae bacterium]